MKSITAKEFDKKFDNNEDITEYLDFSKAMKLKEFKKIKETKKINLDIPQNILNFIDQEANKIGVTRQALLKVWIFERLKKLGRLDLLDPYQPPKNNSKWSRPRTLKVSPTEATFCSAGGCITVSNQD